MGKMESALRDEIARLARKEIRNTTDPLKKQIKELKTQMRRLRRIAGKAAPAQPNTDITLSASKRDSERLPGRSGRDIAALDTAQASSRAQPSGCYFAHSDTCG